jgi:uncharacterized membrane protein
MDRRNRVLWILQWLVGLFFDWVGVMHFVLPEGLPEPMSWMYELDTPLHVIAGTAEILGGLGLILPSITRIRPGLTPLAVLGLILVMLAAMVWHIGREEYQQIVQNLVVAAVLAYVAYGRWRVSPLSARAAGTE